MAFDSATLMARGESKSMGPPLRRHCHPIPLVTKRLFCQLPAPDPNASANVNGVVESSSAMCWSPSDTVSSREVSKRASFTTGSVNYRLELAVCEYLSVYW